MFSHWWFTPIQVQNLFHQVGLSETDYTLRAFGNLLTQVGTLLNLRADELTCRELEFVDPCHPVLICARVVKPVDRRTAKPEYRDPWEPVREPAKWNPILGHHVW
ncbi:MAG: hypothetical protein QN120_06310 [Armatimonadota bacterium]|nr:hypothetical protein [Armatimonadota bacterium]